MRQMNRTVLLDPGHEPSIFWSSSVCVCRGATTAQYGGDRSAEVKTNTPRMRQKENFKLGKSMV